MRTTTILVTAFAAALAVAAPGLARIQTTTAPATFTVKVLISDGVISMHPNHAVRGSTAIFVLTNRGTKTHTAVIGDPARGKGKTIGFSATLAPNQQKTVVMFLDYRGLLPYSVTGAGSKGSFRIN